jgi:hypothetical protein
MRYGSGFRVLAALVLLGVIGLLTAGAWGAGFAAGQSSGVTSVAPWAYGGAFGAGHVVGLLVTILVLIILLRLIGLVLFGGRHRAWGHHAYWYGEGDGGQDAGPGFGPGGWHRSEWRQAGQAAFDEFHRQAHGAGSPAAGGEAAGGNPGAPSGSPKSR